MSEAAPVLRVAHLTMRFGGLTAVNDLSFTVERGRITEATLNHRAATLTLKLVAATGGEAFAGTAFSVLTPGGDVIREAIGAFPTVTLAEGAYVLIARHDGRVYTREQLLDGVWGRDIYIDERTVDVHVGRLRKAVNAPRQIDPIRTVRGSGYAFDETFTAAA